MISLLFLLGLVSVLVALVGAVTLRWQLAFLGNALPLALGASLLLYSNNLALDENTDQAALDVGMTAGLILEACKWLVLATIAIWVVFAVLRSFRAGKPDNGESN